jgi:hypothetical protein
MALLGPREMSDLSPQSGPKRTLMIQIVVTNRDFMRHVLALLWQIFREHGIPKSLFL